MKDQMVLVSEAALIHSIGAFQGYSLEPERYLATVFAEHNSRFMRRAEAESDPRFKQLIPYVILRTDRSIFTYVRGKQSGESRLVLRRSIGLGGHIEPTDDRTLFSPDQSSYLAAADREVDEEVQVGRVLAKRIVGLINDDSDEVGKVHLGIVHIWDLAAPDVKKREAAITQTRFATVDELQLELNDLESWSQIGLRILRDPRTPRFISIEQEQKGQDAERRRDS